MKRLSLLAFAIIILVIGGGITSQLSSSVDVAVHVTDVPDGSVFDATPEQSLAFFLMVGFILSNVVVAGVIIMVIFWWLDKRVRIAKQEPAASSDSV